MGLDALEGSYLKAVWLRMGEKRRPSEGEMAVDEAPGENEELEDRGGDDRGV